MILLGYKIFEVSIKTKIPHSFTAIKGWKYMHFSKRLKIDWIICTEPDEFQSISVAW